MLVYSIRFTPESSEKLKCLAKSEGITSAELIRKAINFYHVKIEAKINNKKIFLEDSQGNKEWVVV